MKGAFCLVLHGHLPWVLHHGRYPHGEDWLYEAACETWLPLLEALDACADEGLRPGWTVGITPVLLEQLAHSGFAEGFRRYLADCGDQAECDQRDFDAWGDGHRSWLAGQYRAHFAAQREQLDALAGGIVGAFVAHAAAGRVELLSSNATHAYHPLLLHDTCARAQVRTGLATSERHFGRRPRGVWLPECAYRPPGPWHPPVVHGNVRHKAGVGGMYADEGVRHLVVDDHLITGGRPQAVIDGDRIHPIGEGGDPGHEHRAWCNVLEPHRVVEAGVVTDLTVLGRCADIASQVWSADLGYPGDGRYREFHKRHGMRGLRYWKVTHRGTDLGDKAPYHPDDAEAAVQEHAHHFVDLVRQRLLAHADATGRYGLLCAPFDAELFGHWWAEGPRFLLEVARRIERWQPDVDALTLGEALDRVPADKGVALPEGSWGAEGDHRVWLRPETRLGWVAMYRAEDRFLDLLGRAAWRTDADVEVFLLEAGRQLLLLEASDWPFVISTAGAVDYGGRRLHEHAARFDDLCNGVEDLIAGREPDRVARAALAWCREVDPVFPDLHLGWWT